MAIVPRPYQQRAFDAVFDYFGSGETGNPLIALPTGSGKSLVNAMFVAHVLKTWPTQRILCLTHVRELIRQNYLKLMELWSDAPAGIYSAGLKRRDARSSIVFGGIQTAHKKAHELGFFDLVLVDECHLVSMSSDTAYRSFFEALCRYNPRLRIIGLTATPYRLKGGMLTEGKDRIFTDVILDLTQGQEFVNLIDDGYLSRLRTKETETQIDTSSVHHSGGEFVARELEAIVDTDGLIQRALDEAMTYGRDRKAWLFFCPGVGSAKRACAYLNSRNVTAAVVDGAMPTDERDRVLSAYQRGEIRALLNCKVLTTGFDYPGIDLIGMLAPTESAGLMVQEIGRGMRTVYARGHDVTTQDGRLAAIAAGPKQDCLILDYSGNIARHGPVNAIRIKRPGMRGGGEAPTKTCPQCAEINPASVPRCICCGHEFPIAAPVIHATASSAAVIARDEDLRDWWQLDGVTYSKHVNAKGEESLKVAYTTGIRAHYEWVCIGRAGHVGAKATRWWKVRLRNPTSDIPTTVDEALDRCVQDLRTPGRILVDVSQKYPQVIAHDDFDAGPPACLFGRRAGANLGAATATKLSDVFSVFG